MSEQRNLKIAICIGLLLMFFATVIPSRPALGTETLIFDGAWWQGMSRAEQLMALEGMLTVFTYYDNVDVEKSRYYRLKFSKEFGTYLDDITAFYEAHPKRTSVTPADLLSFCFADNSQTVLFKRAGINTTCDDFGKSFDSK